jgi:chromosome segregation ATPase
MNLFKTLFPKRFQELEESKRGVKVALDAAAQVAELANERKHRLEQQIAKLNDQILAGNERIGALLREREELRKDRDQERAGRQRFQEQAQKWKGRYWNEERSHWMAPIYRMHKHWKEMQKRKDALAEALTEIIQVLSLNQERRALQTPAGLPSADPDLETAIEIAKDTLSRYQ